MDYNCNFYGRDITHHEPLLNQIDNSAMMPYPVIFESVFDEYPVDCDIVARVMFSESYEKSDEDTVIVAGILRPLNINSPSAWCSSKLTGNHIIIEANRLPKPLAGASNVSSPYQLLYLNKEKEIVGISREFVFRNIHHPSMGLTRYYENDEKTCWSYRSRFAVLMAMHRRAIEREMQEDFDAMFIPSNPRLESILANPEAVMSEVCDICAANVANALQEIDTDELQKKLERMELQKQSKKDDEEEKKKTTVTKNSSSSSEGNSFLNRRLKSKVTETQDTIQPVSMHGNDSYNPESSAVENTNRSLLCNSNLVSNTSTASSIEKPKMLGAAFSPLNIIPQHSVSSTSTNLFSNQDIPTTELQTELPTTGSNLIETKDFPWFPSGVNIKHVLFPNSRSKNPFDSANSIWTPLSTIPSTSSQPTVSQSPMNYRAAETQQFINAFQSNSESLNEEVRKFFINLTNYASPSVISQSQNSTFTSTCCNPVRCESPKILSPLELNETVAECDSGDEEIERIEEARRNWNFFDIEENETESTDENGCEETENRKLSTTEKTSSQQEENETEESPNYISYHDNYVDEYYEYSDYEEDYDFDNDFIYVSRDAKSLF